MRREGLVHEEQELVTSGQVAAPEVLGGGEFWPRDGSEE
jgi:hypothetical protein